MRCLRGSRDTLSWNISEFRNLSRQTILMGEHHFQQEVCNLLFKYCTQNENLFTCLCCRNKLWPHVKQINRGENILNFYGNLEKLQVNMQKWVLKQTYHVCGISTILLRKGECIQYSLEY